MNHTPRPGARTRRGEETDRTIDDPEQVSNLLAALEDTNCRSILEATEDESLSASELSDACELPLSTTYRKVEKLTDVGLLNEQIRLSASGKHTSEYALAVDDVHMSVEGDAGVELQVSHRSTQEQSTRLVAGAD